MCFLKSVVHVDRLGLGLVGIEAIIDLDHRRLGWEDGARDNDSVSAGRSTLLEELLGREGLFNNGRSSSRRRVR
jgi:hypothetical protein